MLPRVSRAGLPAAVAALLGCARASPAPTVQILSPADADTVLGDSVVVRLAATGVEIVPATEKRPGTGHHHLFVDADVTPADSAIPQGLTGILHLGRAQTEFTLTGLGGGAHRVIAVVADGDHVPLRPLVVDTVRFVVRP